ncbi:hypothetical protein BN938_1125 [Mucinivorans hirudinis]|uniref:Uncharacterized protein n=1 Tax=Mucinivorans hirudinis TaxID=1433126 RepID=A0A060R7J0_9BACT|nr:hypothetical protein BN938_1125 [Mucinivorans hirudinis]
MDRDLITETNKTYTLTDKLFGMWINRVYGDNQRLFDY